MASDPKPGTRFARVDARGRKHVRVIGRWRVEAEGVLYPPCHNEPRGVVYVQFVDGVYRNVGTVARASSLYRWADEVSDGE